MVSSKGIVNKATGPRILDQSRASKNAKDSKICSENERIKMGDPSRKSMAVDSCAKAAARTDVVNRCKGKAQVAQSAMGKCDNSGRLRTGRKALADVSNLVKDGNPQQKNRLSTNPKLMKDKLDGSKVSQGKTNSGNNPYKPRVSLSKSVMVASVVSNKPKRENIKSSAELVGKINAPVDSITRKKMLSETNSYKGSQRKDSHDNSKLIKGHGVKLIRPRLSFATQKVVDGNTSSGKLVKTKATSLRTTAIRRRSDVENSFSRKPSKKKEAGPRRSGCDDNESIVPQGCDPEKVQPTVSHCSNENVTTVISRPKQNRRKSYTLSLVARSEIMGGCIDSEKNDELPKIDDTSNPLEVAEYVDDIYQYYWTMEILFKMTSTWKICFHICELAVLGDSKQGSFSFSMHFYWFQQLQDPSLANYMAVQPDITPRMRGILVNWLIEVHLKFQLMQETLFLMVELLDRVLSVHSIQKEELQMVGLTALLLASKYEDYWHPKINELISISVYTYTRDQMLAMEKLILRKLRFRLNVPTPYVFMLRFLKAARSDQKLEHLAFYLIELCLMEYDALKYKPSLLCASAIYVARLTLQMVPAWTGLLRKYARYEESQLRTCAEMILGLQRAASLKPGRITYEKFLSPERSSVAAIKSLHMLPP